ncbi:MAG: TlpA disulfide reductase family protein [Gemmatimonadota bacterium]|uniref:TlpA disulfide reductase family protein n=1 Tax=Candidatus Palauibacter scopulicola TaxID=3056741 RepID=UPI002393364E|nr:TlpA disulfide reductase family protein [Candidatus Palauibacter scopulicola]MDE2662451.1 TlpA disulfide reductase family protein [Candidatus Palauibacter scopulicola]
MTFSTVRLAGLAGLAVLAAGCGDARPHSDLMADAAADVEAVRLEQAMTRYDSARTKAPDQAEAHRQYAKLASYFSLHAEAARAWERVLELEPGDSAAWEGYIHDLRWAGIFETDRRYAEKILQVLPEALRHAPDRPVIYDEGQEAAADLGQLDAYGAILAELQAMRPDDQILLHAVGALRVALADQEEGDRGQAVRDSIGVVLDALAAGIEDDPDVAAPVLYRLAAGYDFRVLRREDDADRWLERLEAAPDRGALADDPRYWDLLFDFQEALYGDADEGDPAEPSRLVAEGLKSRDLGRRAVWVSHNHTVVTQQALASITGDAPSRTTVWRAPAVAGEPPHARLEPEVAGQLLAASMDAVRWRESVFSTLRGLLFFGIEPEAVLGEAIAIEENLRAHSPGYLYPGSQGDERERSRQSSIAGARILQARALTQLGEIEAAGALFEQVADESRGAATLGEYGRHLLRTDRPAEALDVFVEAIAFGGSRFRPLADEAAAEAGLSPETVEERLAIRQPVVAEELERRELGQRIEREAPEFAIADQNGFEWRLSDLEGKIVVLKFWATWCGPCIEEFPHFVELLKTYEDDEDVVFLTVATAGSPRDEVAAQIEEGGFTFPVLFDEQGLALDYEVLGYPTTFYLDQAGFIQFKRGGFVESGYEGGVARRIDALRGQ